MATDRDTSTQTTLEKLLAEHGLSSDSILYREVEREALTPTASGGRYRLTANPNPIESVVDIYGPGYVVQADAMGPGLAFAESRSEHWQETLELRALRSGFVPKQVTAGPAVVEVRLGDLLSQGGLMYPVESVTVERAWYFTLPSGSIEVSESS